MRWSPKTSHTDADVDRFCCSTRPAVDLTSSSNEALVIFQSNMTGISAAQRRGFHLVYSLGSSCNFETPIIQLLSVYLPLVITLQCRIYESGPVCIYPGFL